MKYACPPLRDFIQDFKLTNPLGADCFEATVDFIVGGSNIKIESEVHIVTSYPGKRGIVYLLTREITVNELPTMFDANRETFEYIPQQNLRIEGTHPAAGKYIAFISPTNTGVTY
ncbi:hypothetical protein QWZ08_20320 [Ferruginibacter paludis]|uniref:hypothetical protein n=1 Tax=Ferruginibacter paludis TaxID=1310417 RepID=UPI0025B499CF|nr:hypothetical protein [Ferruginibacter paludis]MDN3658008.1 hypothetical protein [Ferruginibacter paludis]